MIIEELAKKYRYRLFRSEEYRLHSGTEHEYDLELHLKGDRESFISLYDPDTLYVYLSNRYRLVRQIRKLGFSEIECYKESVFHIPISQFDSVKDLIPIIKIRSFSETEKERLRTQLKSIHKTSIEKELNYKKSSERDQKGIIIPYEK